MKTFLKNLKTNIKLFFYNLIYGMKNTEDVVFHQSGVGSDNTISIHQQTQDTRVSSALLRGEVTQEVSELRYRTYKVDQESKSYKYYAPTLALKRDKQDTRFIKYDDSDGLELITIQPNDLITKETYLDYCDIVGKELNGKVSNKDYFDVNHKTTTTLNDYLGVQIQNKKSREYRIKIKRDFIPRYKIEEYITRMDVKKLDDENVILDILVSKYPNQLDFKSKGFVREIEKIRDERLRSDVISFDEIYFTTSHAYKLDDMITFKFKNFEFKEIVEFDGHYIIRMKASYDTEVVDLTQKYYSKTQDTKYKNKEKKDTVANYSDYIMSKVYVCEECGKEVVFDNEMMDDLNVSQGRDITDKNTTNENPNVLEFMDMQLSEQTFGRKLCSNCLRKYLQEAQVIM